MKSTIEPNNNVDIQNIKKKSKKQNTLVNAILKIVGKNN